jgi:hypothetical protein
MTEFGFEENNTSLYNNSRLTKNVFPLPVDPLILIVVGLINGMILISV